MLARLIPWDDVCSIYNKHVGISNTGRPPLNPRIVIGSLIIKHLCNLDDRETVDQITENIYMQYFLGYSSFTNEPPFDPSLFVEFRKRLGMDNVNAMNERIVAIKTKLESEKKTDNPKKDGEDKNDEPTNPSNKGRVIYDATAGSQGHCLSNRFLDELSWDAFNEGSHMMNYVEQHCGRFGYYPRELLADQIYCTRENRAALKEKGIKLLAKPLGRPSAVQIHVSPGERNPIEGKFGQAKTGYGLNRIKARLRGTSETWIACIFLVLNLVKLAGVALPCLLFDMCKSFSARLSIIVKWNIAIVDRLISPVYLYPILNKFSY